jgi:hypothetical protein
VAGNMAMMSKHHLKNGLHIAQIAITNMNHITEVVNLPLVANVAKNIITEDIPRYMHLNTRKTFK